MIIVVWTYLNIRAVMALIRSLMGLFPCPICLIPSKELGNIHATAPLRDMNESMQLVAEGIEEKLKQQSLRPLQVIITDLVCTLIDIMIQNAFLDVPFSDPFKSLSWDHMYNYAGGLRGRHLWPVLLEFIGDFKGTGMAKVDAQ
jgi:hypothetical protein